MTNHQSNKKIYKKGFQFVKVLKSSKNRERETEKLEHELNLKNLEIKSFLLVDIFSPKAFHICILLLLSLLDLRDLRFALSKSNRIRNVMIKISSQY